MRYIRYLRLASATLCLLISCLGAIAHSVRAEGCTLTPPTDPQPGNLDVIAADSVTLRWKANCATAYELHIGDQTPIDLTIPEYAFSPRQGIVSWRVIAFDGDGHHAEGSTWRFEVAAASWLATPIPISPANLLYQPPALAIDLGALRETMLAGGATIFIGGLALLLTSLVLRSRRQRR